MYAAIYSFSSKRDLAFSRLYIAMDASSTLFNAYQYRVYVWIFENGAKEL